MPSLLAIETTTDICSVAIYDGEHVVIEKSISKPRAHAEKLIPLTQEVLAYVNMPVRALDGVVVSGGPGSYTGLRIGVSTAKGLAYAYNLDLIAIPSLEAMAHLCSAFIPVDSHVLITRNARKDELYLALYKKAGPQDFELLVSPRAVQHEELPEEIYGMVPDEGPVPVAGEGAETVLKIMATQQTLDMHAIPTYSVVPSAGVIASLGATYYERQQVVDVASYEPMYLKEFVPKKRTRSIFDRLPF